MKRSFERHDNSLPALELSEVNLAESIKDVLRRNGR
jgi:phosphoribosylformylglycinamidine synthase